MRRPRTARDYQDGITEASRSGLAEVMTVLGAYREALVLIGGWAPHLILEKFGEPGQEYFDAEVTFNAEVTFGRFLHVGSIDIELVVDPAIVDTAQYATIVESLLDRGYEPAPDSLYQFQRMIRSPRDGHDYLIRVDILTPQPIRGQGRTHRHRTLQRDLRARTLPGAEVALAHWFWYDLEASLPDRARAHYTLCAHYRGGPIAVAEALRPYLGEEPVRQGLRSVAERFRTLDAEGPTWVGEFLGEGDPDRSTRFRQDAFMTVGEVCRLVGVPGGVGS